ncbi:putative phage DNA replication protein [Escherichia coli]|uniref:Putative phage DNA replication protein n=1 Tax=Escherichia coli TaxID=562 RepID=A0A376P588_ECOLX|nr:putative phage DNA replication protein [Escherichia coli]
MKNIATGGVLERIRRLTPPHVTAPFRTVAEWREWQLAEGQKRSEEINRLNRQLRVEKILNRSGIQPLHRKCSFANYQVQNDGQRYALSQAKSIADELMTGCTNFAFSGKTWYREESLSGSYRESPAERRSDSDCGYRG